MSSRPEPHVFRLVSFIYSSYLQCECSFRPYSQEDMDEHLKLNAEESTA